MSPPLIIDKPHIDQIVERPAQAIRASVDPGWRLAPPCPPQLARTTRTESQHEHRTDRRLRPGPTAPRSTYSPAPEKILKGDPKQSVRNHYGSPCGQFNAGIWEGAVGQWTVNYTEHEYCEIIQGVSMLRDRHGNAKTVRAGDAS